MTEDEMVLLVENLKFMAKTREQFNDAKAGFKNRAHALGKDENKDAQHRIKQAEAMVDGFDRDIAKALDFWPIYTGWLKQIRGCGPIICANLILCYYFRFYPLCDECGGDMNMPEKGEKKVCTVCGKPAKGEGLPKFRPERKDFRCVSAWWKYMGRAVTNGKVDRMRAGVKCSWSTIGKKTGYFWAESMVKQERGPYRAYYDHEKARLATTHPNASKAHRDAMAKNNTVQLFLSHFWHVARTMEGKPTTSPYAFAHLGHTDYIPPYYWDEEAWKQRQAEAAQEVAAVREAEDVADKAFRMLADDPEVQEFVREIAEAV